MAGIKKSHSPPHELFLEDKNIYSSYCLKYHMMDNAERPSSPECNNHSQRPTKQKITSFVGWTVSLMVWKLKAAIFQSHAHVYAALCTLLSRQIYL